MIKSVKCQLTLIMDIKEYIIGYEIVSISIGADNCYYLLAVNKENERVDDMVRKNPRRVFRNYRVIKVQGDNVHVVDLIKKKWSYRFVQPIEGDKILLACSRTEYRSKNNYDLNGKIFDMDGKLIREFLLGDGIESLQVTSEDIIWTSYFDEGIFGNLGWENPVGSCGLRSWDQYGKPVYEHNYDSEHPIWDCYALNVINNDEVWFYYYGDFLLGRIKNGNIEYFNPRISGAHGFLVYDKYVLFVGESGGSLLEFIQDGRMKVRKDIVFTDESDVIINADERDCRGSKLLVIMGTKLYTIDLKNIVNNI